MSDVIEGKTSNLKMLRIVARIVMVVAALGLVAAAFLPWASADAEFREGAALAPNFMFYAPAGITAADATDLSLFEYAQVYGTMAGWELYSYLIYGLLGVSVLSAVIAAAGKPIGSAVFAILTCALSRLLVWDFSDRGVLPNGTHDWGMAPAVYMVATVVLVAVAVVAVVLKRKEKLTQRAEVPSVHTGDSN